MSEESTLRVKRQAAMIVMLVFGIAMLADGAWAMAAPYTVTNPLTGASVSVKLTERAGKSAKLAVSAGVYSIVLAIVGFVDISSIKKTQLFVVTMGLLLVIALSLAGMSVAVDDLRGFKGSGDNEFVSRRRPVAIICGLATAVEIWALMVTGKEFLLNLLTHDCGEEARLRTELTIQTLGFEMN